MTGVVVEPIEPPEPPAPNDPPTGASDDGDPPRLAGIDLSLDDEDRRKALTVGGATLAVTVFVFILYPAATSVLVLGGLLGLLTAVLAFGLVLIYRANGIINFAQGDLGGVAAVLSGSMIVAYDMPFFAAVTIAFVVAVVLGGLIEIFVIRRFSNAPRLVLTVATFGIAQLLQVAQLGLPQLFDFNVTPPTPEPFKVNLEWFPVVFKGGHVLIAIAVPALAAGLALFFRRSRAGVGIRAAAESVQRASLLGIPVKRLNTLVWVLAAALSAAAALLRVPIQGVSIGAVFDPSLLLLALAAAVFGRMESLPRTFFASMLLGMASQAVLNITGQTVIVDGVVFAVILAVLLLQKGGIGERARDTGTSSWGATKEVRPIPREMRSLPEVRIPLLVGGALVVGFLLFAPLGWSPPDVNLFSVGIIFAMVIVSLVILTGWAGQVTLGHLALVAFGSAVTGVLAQQGRHFFVCLAASIVTGVVVSVAIGIPALRIRGLFYAVTSLAFAVATGTFLLNPKYFGWLVPDPASQVTRFRPVLFDKFDMDSEYTYYYVCLFFLAFTVAVVSRLRSSRTGRTLIANRDNTRAAQSYGISANKAQLTAFGISGGIAGLAGSLFFFHQRAVSGSLLAPNENFILFSVAVVGGLASVPGALLGAAYFTVVKYSGLITTTQGQLFASGLGVLLVLLVLPNGLGGLVYDVRDRILRAIAARKGMVVPSLLADVRVEDLDDLDAAADDPTLVDQTSVFGEPDPPPADLSQPSDDPLILVRGLEVAYGKTQVLFGVDFHVERGEIVALLGTNGAGKSTLLSAMTGLVRPMAGTVTYDGGDLTGADAGRVVREGMVLMPGGKGVFPTLTVRENLDLAGWIHDDKDAVETTIEHVLETFPRLRERLDQKAGNMSGGEQQMLTLGQALILKPKVLFIDELSLGLAPIIVEQLLGIVREIHAQGTTIVLVEQSVNVAIALAQRAVFMEKGEVRFDGPTADLLDRPEILRAVFLQGVGAKDAAGPEPEPARTRGRPVRAGMTPEAPSAPHTFDGGPCVCGREHPVLLELDEMSVSFGGVQAVRGVSFAVRQEQIIGMIGPNGAGKTTIFDLISGFVTPTGGRVRLGGTDVTELTPSGRALLGLGRSFQDARLFSAMTVRETIATALERHVKVRDPLAAIVLSPAVKFSEQAVADEVETLIELMNLQAFADKFVGELSTGSRRIVDIACSLAHRPDVLLLDEPSSGIAQRETEALGPVIQNIRDQLGAAIVVIEHDMPLITGISDELIALELGAVIARGEPQSVVTDPRVVEGYLGGTDEVINRSGPTS